MNTIEFDGHNEVIAKNQTDKYNPIPAHIAADGTVTMCWSLDLQERRDVSESGKIWLQVLTFGQSLQPLWMGSQMPALDNSPPHVPTGFVPDQDAIAAAKQMVAQYYDLPEFDVDREINAQQLFDKCKRIALVDMQGKLFLTDKLEELVSGKANGQFGQDWLFDICEQIEKMVQE